MRIRNKILFFFCFILLFSCSSPRRLVREFIDKNELPPVLYISEPEMFIQFHRPDEILDSINYYKPEKIMYFLDDSVVTGLKEKFDSVFTQSLANLGFKTYSSDSIAQFFKNSGPSWQLSPVQITFEEHRIWFSDDLHFTDFAYYFDTIISEFQYNVWFELSPVNGDSSVPVHLLYSSEKSQDKLNGRFAFDWNLKTYRYFYDFYESDSTVFHILTDNAAKKNANYLFDFFLNRYLYIQNYEKPGKRIYYTYDREKRNVKPARNNRFIFIQNER